MAYIDWQLARGGISIGPHDQVHGKNAAPGRIIWNIETTDVKGDFERLKAAGAIVVREPYNRGLPDAWIATLADPDDNYFQARRIGPPYPATDPRQSGLRSAAR